LGPLFTPTQFPQHFAFGTGAYVKDRLHTAHCTLHTAHLNSEISTKVKAGILKALPTATATVRVV